MTNNDNRLFVLDTNVLMHDPTALFRFQEHASILPMIVLEELDHGKKGLSEVARNVRQVSRFIDSMIEQYDNGIEEGVPIKLEGMIDHTKEASGRLFFQTVAFEGELPKNLPGDTADNNILAIALSLQNKHPSRKVTLVSKDINLRIKASVVKLHSEDYFNDQVLDDADLLPVGFHILPADFWETHSKDMDSWQEESKSFYKLKGPLTKDWATGEVIILEGDQPFQAIVRDKNAGEEFVLIETIKDFTEERHAVWGINALNTEQNLALNLLTDPEVDFVTLLGAAGTGKTLLSLAAGLAQALETKRYTEIIMTRVTIPVGEDIGFLPGTEEEKMAPWMGALMDNLEVLTQPSSGGSWGRSATDEFLMSKIKLRSLNFMRGRTFLNRYIIIDEAQNLTPKQMKTLITRAGPGTKVVCLGNVAQIDTPYLTETSSGLTYVVDRFRGWEHGGHVTLKTGERSRLAGFAEETL